MSALEPTLVLARGQMQSPWPDAPTLRWLANTASPCLQNPGPWQLIAENEEWFLAVDAPRQSWRYKIICGTRPWARRQQFADDLPMMLRTDQHPALIVSDCGPDQGAWFDGPLAQCHGDDVENWVTSGGPAALRIQIHNEKHASTANGTTLQMADGLSNARDQRWLSAWIESSLGENSAVIDLPQLDQLHAMLLALASCQLRGRPLPVRHPELPAGKTNPPSRDWPQPWPTLAKRLGLVPGSRTASSLRLGPIKSALRDLDLDPLRHHINRRRMLLSDSVWQSLANQPI